MEVLLPGSCTETDSGPLVISASAATDVALLSLIGSGGRVPEPPHPVEATINARVVDRIRWCGFMCMVLGITTPG
jgi:hypothetical protein